MMSQNIQYKEYLSSKWYLVIIATVISTFLATFYLYFAYVKTPIDLTTNKKAFGDKQAFNAKTLLITLPKLLLPIIIYTIGHFAISPTAGYIFVAVFGLLGFVFKNKMFEIIEKIYKKDYDYSK